LTGLYDMRARQWSPELGVFVTADEFGLLRKDSTLWGWPGQNPFRYRDPTGRDAEEWFLRNGNYVAAGVAAVAVAPLAILGAAEVIAGAGAVQLASISTMTMGMGESIATGAVGSLVAGSLSNEATREWYLEQLQNIPAYIDQAASLRDQALQAFQLRNDAKEIARELMSDQDALAKLPPPPRSLT